MENTKYGRRREGRWTPIRAKAQDTRANPSSWETHQVRKRWDIGLLWALSLRIMMMMMISTTHTKIKICSGVSIDKNAFHEVFVQYLGTEFSDLWLVSCRWATYIACTNLLSKYRLKYMYTQCNFHMTYITAMRIVTFMSHE